MRIDWNSISHFFQIPLEWFRDVDRRSRIIPDGNVIKADRNNAEGTVLSIDKDALNIPSSESGAATDRTDAPTVLDTSGDSWSWAAGSGNGVVIDAYYKCGESGNYHFFQRCRLTISSGGLVVAAQGLPDRIRIRA